MMTRRTFLQFALLSATYTLLAACAEDEPAVTEQEPAVAPGTNQNTEVLVVGAGIAGLAAARSLVDEDYDVILLEARNRIGGRVWTSRAWPDSPLDMGASWIHGIQGNPITDLAEELGVETAETDYDSQTVYDATGQRLSEAQLNELEEALEELGEELEELGEDLENDISLQTAIDQIVAGWDLSAEELRRLNFGLNGLIEQEFAADTEELSLWYWNEGEAFGGEDVIFPQGYDQIISGLARGLDIRLGHIVTEIRYGDRTVEITTNQGVFTAGKAIITLPLGVLKQGSVHFDPPLPADKQAAINKIGMGLLNKVYLRFPEVFWDEDSDWISHVSQAKGEWAEFLNIYKYTGRPVLVAFNAGRFGRTTESWSDEAIVTAVTDVLQTLYGAGIPAPEARQITRWAGDPLAGGSYSYLAPGSRPRDRDTLAAPVDNLLFFAGEATSKEYPATVHGAYLSGLRAAEEVDE